MLCRPQNQYGRFEEEKNVSLAGIRTAECPPSILLTIPTTLSHLIHSIWSGLTLILLMWSIGWAPNNASKWQMGFNLAFKGLNK